jgi:SAM-dependent methyltransferase
MPMHKGRVIDIVNNYEIIECEECGFKHINPIPTQEELDRVYREDYYTTEKPKFIERQLEDIDWWNLVYGERYDTFEKNLPENRRRILDVGSGPGFFLLHGKNRGWQVVGIEPSLQAAAYSRKLGLEVIENFLTDKTPLQIGKFDVIHMSEVLEHIPNPTKMIQLAHSLLSSGGLLCVVVPNDYNPFQYALRNVLNFHPWWIAPPHHINYFNFDSLSLLLANNGYEILLTEATFPIDMFLLMGDNYIGKNTLGRLCHRKRMAFERNLAAAGLTHIKRQLYEAFASNGLGREIVLIAKKQLTGELTNE